MAWISVHEQVIGGKLRLLAKELNCSQNEALGILVNLWLWGIKNADKHGMIVGATKKDVANVLNVGLDERLRPFDVVDALAKTSWIDVENDLYIHDWSEWQGQWYRALEIRERDNERKRKERAKKREDVENIRSSKSQNSEEPNIPQSTEFKKKVEGYTKEFEEWWSVYPRKVGKGEAYKKYKARLNDGWSPNELMEAAQNYRRRAEKERTEQRFIKHPKTFLSESTPFTDFLKEMVPLVKQGTDDDPFKEWRT